MYRMPVEKVLETVENDMSQIMRLPKDQRFIPILTARPIEGYSGILFIHDTLQCAGESSFYEFAESTVIRASNEGVLEIWKRDSIAPFHKIVNTDNDVEAGEIIASSLGSGNVHLVCHSQSIMNYLESLKSFERETHTCFENASFNQEEYLKPLEMGDETRIDFTTDDISSGTLFPIGRPVVLAVETREQGGMIVATFPGPELTPACDVMSFDCVVGEDVEPTKGQIKASEIELIDGWSGYIVGSWRVANNRRALTIYAPDCFFAVVNRLPPAKIC